MPTTQLSPLESAQLLLDTREDILKGDLGEKLGKVSDPDEHSDAGITKDRNVLVITGSDKAADYLFYNVRPFRPLTRMVEIDQLCRDFPRKAFHRGFLLHAARVLRFVGDDKPDFIVGHSLGAAAAQIIGTALRTPTMCLASPQVIKRRFLMQDGVRLSDHPQWNVFNAAWKLDFVTQGYRMLGYRMLGHRMDVNFEPGHPMHNNLGIDHFVSDYKKLIIADTLSTTPRLPTVWPDSTTDLPTRLA